MQGENAVLLSLFEIHDQVDRLAQLIGAHSDNYPLFGQTNGMGRPHVEVDEAYHYVVSGRGTEFSRDTTEELDTLLYWIFRDITSEMSAHFELRHRKPGEDFRRQMFEKQIELLKILSSDWASEAAADHREILMRHPFSNPRKPEKAGYFHKVRALLV